MMEDVVISFWWIWFCIFFSGYSIVYVIAYLLSNKKNPNVFIKNKIYPLLPLAYVLMTTCFWIFILYKANLTFVSKRLVHSMLAQALIGWSLFGFLFWLPLFRKNSAISLMHSLPFLILPLAFIAKNILRLGVFEKDDILNLLRIYTVSASIYLLPIIILLAAKFAFSNLVTTKHHQAR